VNRECLQQSVSQTVKEFATWIKSIDWRQIITDVQNFAHEMEGLVNELGGAQRVAEAFFAIWGVSKITPVLGAMSLLAGPSGVGLIAAAAIGASAALDSLFNKLLSTPVDKLNQLLGISLTPEEKAAAQKKLEQQYGGSTVWERMYNFWRPAHTLPPDVEKYIREAAIKRGIDPNVAVQVARNEGGGGYVGDRGSSFGPYQLHMGGLASGGMAVSGLGDEFRKKTGLDPRDPSTWQAQVDFSLNYAKEHGWSPWHGWKGLPYAGIHRGGAAEVASSRGTVNNSRSSSETHIGEITIKMPPSATDANGIAKEIGPAIRRNDLAAQANTGAN